MIEATVPRAGRREWIGLAVLILPTILIAMDVTVEVFYDVLHHLDQYVIGKLTHS